VVAARYRSQRQCILFIAATSRCRHKPNAPSPSRHRCRLRVVRVNKKTMPDKTPGTGFFIATHHPESQAWSLRVLSFYSRPLAGRICACMRRPFDRLAAVRLETPVSPQPVRLRGVALRCSFPPHLPRFPSAPRGSLKTMRGKAAVVYGAYSVKFDLVVS